MNVERKVALSCVYESYWDMLPPEIQEYILEFKFSQEQIDEAREELMSMLRQEIHLYRSVRVHWEWGHVQCCPPSGMWVVWSNSYASSVRSL